MAVLRTVCLVTSKDSGQDGSIQAEAVQFATSHRHCDAKLEY